MTRLPTKLENYALRIFAIIGGVSTLMGLWSIFVATHDAAVSDHTMLLTHDEFVKGHRDLDVRLNRIETKLDAVLEEQGRARVHQASQQPVESIQPKPAVPLYLKSLL